MPSLAIRPPVSGRTRPSWAGFRGLKLLGNSPFCAFFFPVGGIHAIVHVSFHQETPIGGIARRPPATGPARPIGRGAPGGEAEKRCARKTYRRHAQSWRLDGRARRARGGDAA